MKLALGQMRAVSGDTAANLKRMETMILEAAEKGADLICFPELSYTGYFVRKEELWRLAEPQDGPFVRRLQKLAKEQEIWIAAGFAEREGDALYNSCVLINRQGVTAGISRKVNLWKSEKHRFKSGETFPVFETEFGKLAMILCYDLEFPEPARIAALKGAELLLCPAAWSIPAKNRWELDLRGNSLFNLLYIAGVNYADELCCGSSAVAGPDGAFVAQASGQEEEVLLAELDFTAVYAQRERIPYFEDFAAELFQREMQSALQKVEK